MTRIREFRLYGFARGASREARPYRDPLRRGHSRHSAFRLASRCGQRTASRTAEVPCLPEPSLFQVTQITIFSD